MQTTITVPITSTVAIVVIFIITVFITIIATQTTSECGVSTVCIMLQSHMAQAKVKQVMGQLFTWTVHLLVVLPGRMRRAAHGGR